MGFKGLDLIECLMSYRHGSSHCTGDWDKDHPQEKEMKKSKMAVCRGLTNSCEKKRSKYTHLKGELQRIAKRNKKDFLSDQCKEIEENNRIRKTRDLVKKLRDTKGTLQAKMGS